MNTPVTTKLGKVETFKTKPYTIETTVDRITAVRMSESIVNLQVISTTGSIIKSQLIKLETPVASVNEPIELDQVKAWFENDSRVLPDYKIPVPTTTTTTLPETTTTTTEAPLTTTTTVVA